MITTARCPDSSRVTAYPPPSLAARPIWAPCNILNATGRAGHRAGRALAQVRLKAAATTAGRPVFFLTAHPGPTTGQTGGFVMSAATSTTAQAPLGASHLAPALSDSRTHTVTVGRAPFGPPLAGPTRATLWPAGPAKHSAFPSAISRRPRHRCRHHHHSRHRHHLQCQSLRRSA